MRSAARLALRRHWRATWLPQIQAAEVACAVRGALCVQLQGDAAVQHATAPWRPSSQRRWQHSAPVAKDPSVCWNCGTSRGPGDLYFCGSCHVIMPADPGHDYFALLGAPRHFDVSQPALELAFKEAQKLLHPDKVSMRPEEERQHSADQASRLNTAYAVLRSPLSRARYLLYLLGASSSPSAEEDTSSDDPALLMQMLEAQEEAAAAVGRPPALRALSTRVAGQLSACEGDLRLAFAHNDVVQASKLTARMSYLTRLSDSIAQSLHAADAAIHASSSPT